MKPVTPLIRDFINTGLSQTNDRVGRSCTRLSLGLLLLGSVACAARAPDGQVFLLVRHAERASSDANANLSAPGLDRAAALAPIAAGYGVTAIYTTDLCRTAQTALPAATRLGLSLHVFGTGSSAAGLDTCTPGIAAERVPAGPASASTAAARLLAETTGATLVVGHSNTVPELIGALAGESACPRWIPLDADRCILPESAYGDLFVLRIVPGRQPTLETSRFGS